MATEAQDGHEWVLVHLAAMLAVYGVLIGFVALVVMVL